MQMSYESICEEMDVLSISYTQKLNEYRQQREYTGQQFQRGYLHLARAKFTMGSRNISQHSYDKRMKATLQIEIDELGKLHYKPDQLPCRVADNISGNLRRRLNNSNKTSQETSTQTSKKSLRDNPLHWFGLFVSPALRASQDHFKLESINILSVTGTERLTHQVNLIKELDAIETRYNELQEAKNAVKLKANYRQDMIV